jgi:hypothetical protein
MVGIESVVAEMNDQTRDYFSSLGFLSVSSGFDEPYLADLFEITSEEGSKILRKFLDLGILVEKEPSPPQWPNKDDPNWGSSKIYRLASEEISNYAARLLNESQEESS